MNVSNDPVFVKSMSYVSELKCGRFSKKKIKNNLIKLFKNMYIIYICICIWTALSIIRVRTIGIFGCIKINKRLTFALFFFVIFIDTLDDTSTGEICRAHY